jgi:zinc finger SWIM domain-containing protein 3
MTLTLDRGEGNYEITDVMLEHNHLLQLPQTCHLMASQRKISQLQAFEIEIADDSGIRPKAAHELASLKLVDSLTLAILVVIVKIICKASGKGSWLLDRLVVC